ncbi:branched-chain amino acid ABC transporter substrate-binding protein [soil metagenome]
MHRRRGLVAGALLASLSLVAAACGGGDGGGGGSAGGGCKWTIGTMGALSGDYASIGVPISQGIEYAVDEIKKKGDVPCTLELRKEDSQGSEDKAPALARSLAQDDSLVAVIGPYFSGETLAGGPVFEQGQVPFITPSATDPSLAEQGWTSFFRAVGNDADQGPTAAQYIQEGLSPDSVVVIDDNTQYGKTLAGVVADSLGSTVSAALHIDPAETDYSAVVSQVKNKSPDVVYYGGYTPQAGPLALQLEQEGVDATFFSDDGSKDPAFGDLAKEAAAGSLVTCPCADPTKLPAAQAFVDGMTKAYDRPPGTFAADGYDAVNLVATILEDQDSGAAATDVRSAIVDGFGSFQAEQGITKQYTFAENGEVEIDPLKDIWIYEWSDKDADFVSIGPAGEAIKKAQ